MTVVCDHTSHKKSKQINWKIGYIPVSFQLAKDPKAFSEKMIAIWNHLSEDEPENQKPPENIEQLIEMLTRESARRFVHVTNFVAKNIYMTPTYSKTAFAYTSHEIILLADQIIKVCVFMLHYYNSFIT